MTGAGPLAAVTLSALCRAFESSNGVSMAKMCIEGTSHSVPSEFWQFFIQALWRASNLTVSIL
jgi:hypothetical protein